MSRKPRRTRFAQIRNARAYMLYVGVLTVLLVVSVTLMQAF